MKTPGVYIVERNTFPNSVVEVATAVPAFVGHTEKAVNGNMSLLRKPWKIKSMAEYQTYFGGAPNTGFSITELDTAATDVPDFVVGGKKYKVTQGGSKYLLYYSMLLFYTNGGGTCYIVSVGSYGDALNSDLMIDGINELEKESEPSILLIPETTLLADVDASSVVHQAMLAHCGDKMKNRFAILDIWDGFRNRNDPAGDPIANFKEKIGVSFLNFAAAYYPWLNTRIVLDNDLSYLNVTNKDVLQQLITEELLPAANAMEPGKKAELEATIARIAEVELPDKEKKLLNKTLAEISPIYAKLTKAMKSVLNLMPPGAAVAGVYTMVDNSRGVWKAPANVSLNSVVTPAVNISHDDQEELNVSPSGKSINVIRSFTGEGILVWGARTLDGNSPDWRYINVRRTIIMLEESIKIASKAYVFEPNAANTWVTMKNMISNFLTGIWKQGGLIGASPDDAYRVQIGLGETMTAEDILEGNLRITVLVAIIRPAEFIEITFQQQMQKP